MKKMLKNALAILVASGVIMSILAGCGGGSQSAGTTAAGSEKAESTTKAGDEKKESEDTKKETEADTGNAEEPLEIKAMLIMYQQPPDQEGIYWKDMEEKYNINYVADWVQDSTYSDKLALVLSTNDLPDIVQIANTTEASVVKAIEAGQFKDLTPYLDFDQYPNLGKISASAWTNSKYKGNNYVFPRSRGQYNDSIMIRGDVLEKNNMDIPATIDEFTEYLRAVKKEDGMIPVSSKIHGNIFRFQPCFGDGNVVPVFTEDGSGIYPQHLVKSYADAVEWLRGLYAEDLLAKEFAMFDGSQEENAFLSGKNGIFFKNVWHRYRINDELHKVLPDSEAVPMFSLTGDGGTSLMYDKGFFGGIMVNSKLDEDKFARLMDFFEETAKPENYFYFTYGIEGTHYELVEGFPQLTEEGTKEVNNSFYCPYVLATDTYNKVDSPLAPPEYNNETRELVKVVDDVAADMGYAPFMFFDIISSKSYSDFWALTQDEFNSNVVNAITGVMSMEEFIAYQESLLELPEVQAAMEEFKVSWDEFGLADWAPPKM